ncbi:hypothetical protein [Hymenobacter sp. B81]|uniref:hypothetical protein n=1 Tax=Hymenobacter sp. B81 TaxID=3344878 RepID=UPI0037DD033D
MPKTIDYPRTSYLGAWEVAEVVDDTGGKCSVEACARKLNRKVSGSFKAILGSAVKFGLLTSKRELLTTTNLFRRIKHAYDKQEEKVYHREAFLHPPLFMHICRKFRNRELPVHMFDVMLVREFGVEEINAQSVAKAFVEGARMVDVLDERNIIADIDQLAQAAPRRSDLASPVMGVNLFPNSATPTTQQPDATPQIPLTTSAPDLVSALFGLSETSTYTSVPSQPLAPAVGISSPPAFVPEPTSAISSDQTHQSTQSEVLEKRILPTGNPAYSIRINGPGIDTQLIVQDEQDLIIVSALLEKVRKQLSQSLP